MFGGLEIQLSYDIMEMETIGNTQVELSEESVLCVCACLCAVFIGYLRLEGTSGGL